VLLAHGADPNIATSRDLVWPLLFEARKDLNALAYFLAAALSPSPRVTPLHEAAAKGNKRAVELLLAKGANPNALAHGGHSPFDWAVARGRKDVAELLQAHGAKANVKRSDGQNNLFWALKGGNLALMELLLEKGADPNVRDAKGDTPLHEAARRGNIPAAQVLLRRGADPNLHGYLGWTPLHVAAAADKSSPELVRLLLASGADVGSRTPEGGTPLHYAARKGHREVGELLLDAKADVNAQAKNGPPLRSAVQGWQVDMVRLLLARGADPRWQAADGTRFLDWAVNRQGRRANTGKELPIIKMLLEHQADINYGQERERGTVLHQAVSDGRQDLVDFLLANGAAIEARDRYGRRPLHRAVSQKNLEMVALLLKRGAQVNARDDQGRTPMYDTWGGSGIDRRIKELLRQHGGTGAIGDPQGMVEGKEAQPGNK
jgi:ankyrin repeat protein